MINVKEVFIVTMLDAGIGMSKVFAVLLAVCVFGVQASEELTIDGVARLFFSLRPGRSYEYDMRRAQIESGKPPIIKTFKICSSENERYSYPIGAYSSLLRNNKIPDKKTKKIIQDQQKLLNRLYDALPVEEEIVGPTKIKKGSFVCSP